jgi:hypothetical protein
VAASGGLFDVCPPDALSGSSGREGTANGASQGGHIMNADELKKLTTTALDQLRTALAAGHSERLTALLKTMARFHRYSVNNICLIVSQRPTATRVAGFHTWRTLGRFVRKGEKGIAILAPIVARRRENEDDESRSVVGFRAAYVFDVEQTDGTPLPEAAEASGDPGKTTTTLTAAIRATGIAVEYADELGGALGLSSGVRIQLLNGLKPAAEFSVLVHEYAHLCFAVAYVRFAGADQCRRVKVRPIAAAPFRQRAERQHETHVGRHWATTRD